MELAAEIGPSESIASMPMLGSTALTISRTTGLTDCGFPRVRTRKRQKADRRLLLPMRRLAPPLLEREHLPVVDKDLRDPPSRAGDVLRTSSTTPTTCNGVSVLADVPLDESARPGSRRRNSGRAARSADHDHGRRRCAYRPARTRARRATGSPIAVRYPALTDRTRGRSDFRISSSVRPCGTNVPMVISSPMRMPCSREARRPTFGLRAQPRQQRRRSSRPFAQSSTRPGTPVEAQATFDGS